MKNDMISTRGKDRATIDEAIQLGLARDGGLFVPEEFPVYSIDEFYNLDNLSAFALKLIQPFFRQSRIALDKNFCDEVFSFPLTLKNLTPKTYALELFHGPTLSFKDFGARFFAQCLQRLTEGKKTKVLVATSGDTGSAVASALHGKKGISGIILFPKGKISQRQEAQITCWGDNIHAIAVNGSFDQCQQLVKMAFAKNIGDEVMTTANSINIARLLPQILFYAYSSVHITKRHEQLTNFIVPCGNLGNVTACYWAKKLGFPIGQILCANNENKVLTEYLNTGVYQARPSIKTLANAMDVGDPSNLERLLDLFSSFTEFKKNMNVKSVHDDEIKSAITACYKKYNYLICPHTATAFHRLSEVNTSMPWVIAATAHPAKFEEIIEPLLAIDISIPDQLSLLIKKEKKVDSMEADYQCLETILRSI